MLLRWKPPPDKSGLPPTDQHYAIMAARKEWHIKSWREWNSLTVEDRANILAHEMISSRRAAYQMKDLNKKKDDEPENDYVRAKRKMGIK